MASKEQEQFVAAAAALNEAADKDLRKEVYAAFRKAAKPLIEKIIKDGALHVPASGGLRARVLAAKASQSNATAGRNPGVAFRFRKPRVMAYIDAGVIPHPVFADRGRRRGAWTWDESQTIRPGAYLHVFEAGREQVAAEVIRALEEVADRIVRESKKGEVR
jgi:hypothetical protein